MCLRRIGVVVVAAALLNPVAGFGQVLEEVLVTAQKREQSLQEVPISITAHSGGALERINIANSDDLSAAIPGLMISRQTNASVNFIRGVGKSNGSAGNEPSVPIYVDGVYNPSINQSIFEFNNIERIEVLKGPQGTLFGRNATGGIIHVITKDPSQDTSGRLKIGVGNLSTVEAKLYGTTGLGENAAADIAVTYFSRDGFMNNLTTGSEPGDVDTLQVRTKWLFTPSDNTDVRFSANVGDESGSNGMARSFETGAFGLDGTQNNGNFFDIEHGFEPDYEHKHWGTSLQIDHAFANVDLVSITSYMETDNFFRIDQDGTPAPIVDAPIDLVQDAFTQELRLQSSWDKSWNWIFGAYYLDFTASYEPLTIAGAAAATAGGFIDVFSTVSTESIAVFAHMDFALSDRATLTLGARKTQDDLEQSGETIFGGFSPFGPYAQSTDFDEPTYRVAIDYELRDGALIYGSFSRGYAAGVYNLVVTGGVPAGALEPEIVDAFEVGIKADLFNDRLRLNAAYFNAEYENLQLLTLVPGSIITVNAPSADTQGLEVEGEWIATDNLNIRFGLAFLDGEYNSFPDAPLNPRNGFPPGGNTSVSGDATGNTIQRAPEFTANLIGSYSIPTDSGTWDLSGIVEHNDGFYWEPNNRVKEPAYTTINATVSWTPQSENFRLSLWGKNLADEEYSNYTTASAFGDLYVPSTPRTYGASIEFNWE